MTCVELTPGSFVRSFDAKYGALASAVGESAADLGTSSAITIVELLSGEGFLALRANGFFRDALPDFLISPTGMPLLIVFAVQLALTPERFGLGSPTALDQSCNAEMRAHFDSRWQAVTRNGFRALDVAVKSAYDSASAHVAGKRSGFTARHLVSAWPTRRPPPARPLARLRPH